MANSKLCKNAILIIARSLFPTYCVTLSSVERQLGGLGEQTASDLAHFCESSTVIVRNLAKIKVVGLIPIFRSLNFFEFVIFDAVQLIDKQYQSEIDKIINAVIA